jgi:hypothetical protein
MNRRHYLAGAATVGVASVAGCLDVLLGEDLTFEASPAQIPDATLAETGYERVRTDSRTLEQTLEAGGESRDVTVTNRHAEYGKQASVGGIDLGDAHPARLMLLTTPEVEVLGQSFNPIAHLSTRQLIALQGGYDNVDDLQDTSNGQVTLAGETTTWNTFETAAQMAGQSIDVLVHVTDAVSLGSDLVVTIGAHPAQLAGEAETLRTLVEAVEPESE